MAEPQGARIDYFVDLSLEKARHIEQALGYLAKAIELELVDVALNPELISNGQREKYAQLVQKLAEFSGISYELVRDISTTTGVSIETGHQEEPGLPPPSQPKIASLSPAPVEMIPQIPAPIASMPQPALVPEPGLSSAPVYRLEAGQRAAHQELNSTATPGIYERLVDPGSLPEMRPVEESEAINTIIWTDSSIKIKNHEIILKKQELYTLNALLLLRDRPRLSSELRAFGLMPSGDSTPSQTLSNSINSLSKKLNEAAGVEIIKKIGQKKSTRYCLNPKLVLVDLRENEPGNITATTPDVKKN